jgi:hypothetical protein
VLNEEFEGSGGEGRNEAVSLRPQRLDVVRAPKTLDAIVGNIARRKALNLQTLENAIHLSDGS